MTFDLYNDIKTTLIAKLHLKTDKCQLHKYLNLAFKFSQHSVIVMKGKVESGFDLFTNQFVSKVKLR